MSQSAAGPQNLQLKGGAAIVAPVSAFPGGIPQNAMVVIPVTKPSEELEQRLAGGPFAVTEPQMWDLLGFNGPPVQVTDASGRPMTIGLEDLLEGLRSHYQENKSDLQRGRMFAGELMKYRRYEEAEKVLARVVAGGGTGEDWLGLGVAQIQQEKFAEAEGTLKGARNLLSQSAMPSLHLAKALKGQNKSAEEREAILQAITTEPGSIDAWAVYFLHLREAEGEEKALSLVDELADSEAFKKLASPYIALQGVFAGAEETRERALPFAEKAVERNPNDVLALVSLSALWGQNGEIDRIVSLLAPHEAKMQNDVRLAHNYFEALFQKRDLANVTRLLNQLMASNNRDVKAFAAERGRIVGQILAQQQAQLQQAGQRSGLLGPNGQPLV